MPYPSKTDAQTILAAAIEYLEQHGEDALTMRELASKLDLTPRALYRYFPDRAALMAAIAQEGCQRLHAALIDSVGSRTGVDALREVAGAYLDFAQTHPAWYPLLMRIHDHEQTPGIVQAQAELWRFVVIVVQGLVGTEDALSAAVALWAFLHGYIELERATVLGRKDPQDGFTVGLEAFLKGFSLTSST
jgi:AcrR family transcriptional regulator